MADDVDPLLDDADTSGGADVPSRVPPPATDPTSKHTKRQSLELVRAGREDRSV
jgi:hypothetical protein